MTLSELINRYEGKYVEVAGSPNALNQCTDLANLYIRDVLGLPIIEWTNAVDFPSKGGDRYDFVANTPTGVPPKGSLVIFGRYGVLYGSAGHIGVVVEATESSMTVFEQNYPTGSPCKLGKHNYLGCKGWMVAKNGRIDEESITPPMSDQEQLFLRLLNEAKIDTEGELREAIGAYKEYPRLKTDKDNLQVKYDELVRIHQSVKEDFTIQSNELKTQNNKYREFIAAAAKLVDSLQETEPLLARIQTLVDKEAKLRDIEDNRPLSGPNWVESLVEAIRELVQYMSSIKKIN